MYDDLLKKYEMLKQENNNLNKIISSQLLDIINRIQIAQSRPSNEDPRINTDNELQKTLPNSAISKNIITNDPPKEKKKIIFTKKNINKLSTPFGHITDTKNLSIHSDDDSEEHYNSNNGTNSD